MNPTIYNTAIAVGVALVGAGVAMLSIAGALVTVGALVIGLTLTASGLGRKR